MSVECYRSRGRNTYYSEGKRISKKNASYLSPKLPKCVSKTKSNEIKNLKKQLKEVMTHREQYKTTSSDLDSRLKACSIVREEYDRLVDMIKSATSSVDVMGRICLTQDLKEKIDREYKELRETLESTTRSYDEKVEKLVSVVEKNQVDIEAYQTEVVSLNNENKGLREVLNDNANVISGLKEQIDRLQEERLKLIEDVNEREAIIYNKNDEIVERMEVIGRLDRENRELKDNVQKMASEYNSLKSEYEDLQDDFEELKEKANNIYAELQASENDNEVLRQRVIDADNSIQEYMDKYTEDMGKADEEIRKLNQKLENEFQKKKKFEEINLNVISILEKKINKLEEDKKILKDNFDEMVVLSDRLDNALASSMEKTSECFAENKELSQTFSGEKFNLESSLFNIQKENKRMRELLENCKDDRDILTMQEGQIETLMRQAEELKEAVQSEKNECLDRVQRAIEESEGNISSREARKYEKELSTLNSRLRLSEEALDELRKAGSLEGKKMAPKSVKKAIKKMNKATVGPQRQIMERVRY
jgi:chromosome segregation ATPase